MICPYCGTDNIQGVDACEHCGQDLTRFDRPRGRSPIEATLMEESLERLAPKPPVMVPPSTTVREAVAMLCEKRIGCVLVGEDGVATGIFSERDVLLRTAHRHEQVADQPVAEFMTADPEGLEIDSTIAYAVNRMSLGDFRHLPVTRDGKLVGIVSLRDILRFLGEWYPDLIPAK